LFQRLNQPPDSAGIKGPTGAIVNQPSYRNAAGDLLQAMAEVGNQVFGLYSDHNFGPPPGGGILGSFPIRYYWDLLATLPTGVTVGALAAHSGRDVFVGTWNDGRMFVITPLTGTALELPVVLPQPAPGTLMKGGSVTRIVAFSEWSLFAVLDGASAKLTSA
jgi:hypothetical protein